MCISMHTHTLLYCIINVIRWNQMKKKKSLEWESLSMMILWIALVPGEYQSHSLSSAPPQLLFWSPLSSLLLWTSQILHLKHLSMRRWGKQETFSLIKDILWEPTYHEKNWCSDYKPASYVAPSSSHSSDFVWHILYSSPWYRRKWRVRRDHLICLQFPSLCLVEEGCI